jgi:hypothetical protein
MNDGMTLAFADAGRCGNAASGRNRSFCAPSISHGVIKRFGRCPKEAEAFIRPGRESLNALESDLGVYVIEA